MKRYGHYGKKVGWIMKWSGKYGRKVEWWKDLENTEEKLVE